MTTKPTWVHPMMAARIVRKGKYAWPGGYALALVVNDGALLCPHCVEQEFSQISFAHRHKLNDGWRPEGLTHSGEWDDAEFCDHCGNEIA